MAKPLYSDLDETLLYSIWSGTEQKPVLDGFVARPGAREFLENMARYGPVGIVTFASKGYAENAVDFLGVRDILDMGVTAWEDLEPVHLAIQTWLQRNPRMTHAEILKRVDPILPKGVLFDNEPVGSVYFQVKSVAAGIDASWWIKVPPFDLVHPDAGGLAKAFGDFERRFVGMPRLTGAVGWREW